MRRRTWVAVASAVGALVWLWLFLQPRERPDFSDFHVYWIAGSKARLHQTAYDVEGHYQFKYSPFVALLWALPTFWASEFIWSALHYVATGIGWYVLLFWLALRVDKGRAWQLWAAGVVVFSVAIRDELKLGQVNLWPFLLVLPAWVEGRRTTRAASSRRDFWIGAAWALAVQWKLYALLLTPLWLLRRRAAVFAGAAAATVLTLGAALALAHGWSFAVSENLRWLGTLTASSQTLLVSQYNVSALGVLGKAAQAFGLPFAAWVYLVWLGLLVAGLGVLVWSERHNSDPLSVFWSASFAWALVAVVNPLVWPYWQLLAAPLFLIYFARGTEFGRRGDGGTFWPVVAAFAVMNWAQNSPVVHYGGGLAALLWLLWDAYRRATTAASAMGARTDRGAAT
jgi:hypothetical protein